MNSPVRAARRRSPGGSFPKNRSADLRIGSILNSTRNEPIRRSALQSVQGSKTPFVRGIFTLLLTIAASALAETTGFKLGNVTYSNVVPGLAYARLQLDEIPLSIHVARLDRAQRELTVVSTLARERIRGLAPLSAQIARLAEQEVQPLAAINGDFFEIRPGPYQGDPSGLQIIAGELVSAATDKAFWLDHAGNPHIDLARSRMEVFWPNGAKTRMGLNEAPWTNAVTLFTSAFGDSTKAAGQIELLLERADNGPWLPLRAEQTYRALVRGIRREGNTTLGSNELVLTVNGSALKHLDKLAPGDVLSLSTSNTVAVGAVQACIGGGPILLRSGQPQPWPSRRGVLDYLQPRHPRTAVGFNDRYLYFVAVDGRQAGFSVGVSFIELASLMQQLGCTEALNLDGGGSTTFWLNGRVVNSPSDGRERSVANGLVIVRRAK